MKPSMGESRQDFLDRCVPMMMDNGEAADQDQAVAMCSTMFEDHSKAQQSELMRAYSLLTVKNIDEQSRTITGIATTPTVDRMGDSVDPMGGVFKTPMPLLLYHNAEKPVGTVDLAKATPEGIPFRASLPEVREPGIVKDRVDEAYHSIKYKLIGAVSIGFRPLRDGIEVMKSGGLLFRAWEWLELTLCSVPANSEALILGFKSMDAARIRSELHLTPRGSLKLPPATIQRALRRPGSLYLPQR